MKNNFFDVGLYWQGIKRLRVLGLALAILCLSICVLIPTIRWSDGPRYVDDYDAIDVYLDGEEVVLEDLTAWKDKEFYLETGAVVKDTGTGIERLADTRLIIPVMVLSYVSPFALLAMFDFLNKRKESDFYHAIPRRRCCVYISFVAAALTWMWGILIVSALSAALIWALCPFVTFSFGGLLTQLFYACVNAALLASFAAAGVSLTGTGMTSFVATMLVGFSWRFVVSMVYYSLDDTLSIMNPGTFWGGYLKPGWLFPLALAGGQVTAAKVWYAVIVTLLTFALGGLLYTKRKSETAERSVPGHAVHTILRTLITLPAALLLTYQMSCDGDFSTGLVLLVAVLLIFYLYELLTTKSARRMVKATPWLGVIICACLIFVGAMYTFVGVERNERTDMGRVEAVTVTDSYWSMSGTTQYERQIIKNSMSDDAEVIALVCEAWEYTQNNPDARYTGYQLVWCDVRMQLKSGRTVMRRLLFTPEQYEELIATLKEDINPDFMPSEDEISGLYLHQSENGDNISLFGEWRSRLIKAMRSDYATMKPNERPRGMEYSSELSICVVTGKDEYLGYYSGSSYYRTYNYQYTLGGGMPETVGVLYELFGLPAYGRAHFANEVLDDVSPNNSFDVTLFDENGQMKSFTGIVDGGDNDTSVGRDILRRGVERAKLEGREGVRILMYLAVENRYGGRQTVICPVLLTEEEYTQLLSIWFFE